MAEQAQWLHVFIDVAPDVSDESASFWSAVLGWPVGEQWPGHPEFRSFTPPAGDSYIHQQIGDHGPRIHFDLEVPDRGTADRLVQLGAVITGYGDGWCPMRSPGGLPFCLIDRADHARPPAQHRTRMVQICIDSRRNCMIKRSRSGSRRLAGGGGRAPATSSPASSTHRPAPALSSSSSDWVPTTRHPRCGHISTWAPTTSRLRRSGSLGWAPSDSGPAAAGLCSVIRSGWCSA